MARLFGITTLTTNLTAAGTPQAVSSTAIYTTGFEIFVPTANSGANIYINSSGGGTTTRRPIPKGSAWSPPETIFEKSSGQYDLSQVFFDGDTTNDDIIVTYTTISRATD